mmetsp:Transcript_51722/g.129810  ORF Transcript_51722/g.129810 Transcript_51722/m.129810 type:complete len:362 (+) Transcript_51722:205-1290(+)
MVCCFLLELTSTTHTIDRQTGSSAAVVIEEDSTHIIHHDGWLEEKIRSSGCTTIRHASRTFGDRKRFPVTFEGRRKDQHREGSPHIDENACIHHKIRISDVEGRASSDRGRVSETIRPDLNQVTSLGAVRSRHGSLIVYGKQATGRVERESCVRKGHGNGGLSIEHYFGQIAALIGKGVTAHLQKRPAAGAVHIVKDHTIQVVGREARIKHVLGAVHRDTIEQRVGEHNVSHARLRKQITVAGEEWACHLTPTEGELGQNHLHWRTGNGHVDQRKAEGGLDSGEGVGLNGCVASLRSCEGNAAVQRSARAAVRRVGDQRKVLEGVLSEDQLLGRSSTAHQANDGSGLEGSTPLRCESRERQ